MKQGEIWFADLEPAEGSEQGGKRPVVVISGHLMNENLPVVITCPLTSKIKNIKGCVVLEKNSVNNLKQNSEILTFQVRTIAKRRLITKIGMLTPNEINAVKQGIHLFMNY